MKFRAALSLVLTLLCTLLRAQADTLHPFFKAEAGYSYQKGNFGQPQLPASTRSYRVYSESAQTIGRLSLYGKMGYTNLDRRQQNWNGMTGSYWQAVNLCDSMPGNQRAEQYQLGSGLVLPLHRHWLVGAAFDYEVQQTAKNTDPRNKNQWMAWQLAPAASYQREFLQLALSLRYATRKEQAETGNISPHSTYPIFAAYPLGFFKTLPLNEKPDWHYTAHELGAACQLTLKRKNFQLLQRFSADLLQQEVKSSRVLNRSEGETKGWKAGYSGTAQLHRPHTRHQWVWQAALHQASSYDPLQNQLASGTPWQRYGRVLRSKHHLIETSFGYRYNILRHTRDTIHPRLSLIADIRYRRQENTLFFYPAQFAQPLHRLAMDAAITRTYSMPRRSFFLLSIGGGYSRGGGTLLHEKQLTAGETSPDIRLWQNAALRQQIFDYETHPRWTVKTALAYTRPLPCTNLCWYIRLSSEYEQAQQNASARNRIEATTCVGLMF